VQSQLWGKAESYLEASLAIAPGWEAHVELAHLAERMDRTDDANRHYRAAAELSGADPPGAAVAVFTGRNSGITLTSAARSRPGGR
jgi:uncharacterized protein HemY